MDDIMQYYPALVVGAIIVNVLFWGFLIYLAWRFISGGKDAEERGRRLGLIAFLVSVFGGRGRGSGSGSGPVSDSIDDMASREGFDRNRD